MNDLVKRLKDWLGKNGIDFFTNNKKEYGEICPVISTSTIPHPVHFREGMQVRNWLRQQPECKSWDSLKLDDTYQSLIEQAISLYFLIIFI